jgi:hypothetical protein
MSFRSVTPLTIPLLMFLCSCDPYQGRDGEYNAGPVDPVNFPPEYIGYLGNNGSRLTAGQGTFVASQAFIGGQATGDYVFSFPAAQTNLAATPTNPNVVFSNAYVFDPPGGASAFPASYPCQKPSADYTYTLTNLDRSMNPNLRASAQPGDGVNYSEQWNIFTALPVVSGNGYVAGTLATTNYAPVVSEVPVTSNNANCQSVKSQQTLQSTTAVTVGAPDGRLLAWAIVDPSAGVYTYQSVGANAPGTTLRGGIPAGGVGLQRWGWFKHYLLAYLDGGYIPVTGGNMVAQTLYIPDRIAAASPTPVGPGRGYDVLQFARGQAGYTPVCRVMIYHPTAALAVAALPKDENTILTTLPVTGPPTTPTQTPVTSFCPVGSPTGSICNAPTFVYCLQL